MKAHIIFKIYCLMLITPLTSCNFENKKTTDITKVYKYGMRRDLQNVEQILPKVNDKVEIDLDSYSDKQTEVALIKLVKICPDMSTLLGTVNKVINTDNKLFILDKLTNTVFIINKNGELLNKIHSIGRSEHEFIKLGDIAIDLEKRNLVLHDVQLKKYLYFTLNGDFIKSIRFPVWSKEFMKLQNGGFCLITLGNNYSGYNIILTDSLLKFSGKALKTQSRYYLNYFSGTLINYQENEELTFSYPFSNSIFSIKDDSLTLKYHLNFGRTEFKFSRDKYRSMQQFSLDRGSKLNNCYFLGNHIENSEYALFSIHSEGKSWVSSLTLKSGNVKSIQFKLKNSFVLTFPKFVDDDCFVSVIDAEWFVRYKKELQKGYDLDGFFDDFNENSNPVLVYFKLAL